MLVVGADNTIQYRAVTLGPIVDGLRVVRTGLDAGDRVVVNGLQRVRPGVQVDAGDGRDGAGRGLDGAASVRVRSRPS